MSNRPPDARRRPRHWFRWGALSCVLLLSAGLGLGAYRLAVLGPRMERCAALRQIGDAVLAYHAQHGVFPARAEWQGIAERLMSVDQNAAQALLSRPHEFRLVTERPQDGRPFLIDDPRLYGGRGANACFPDGHAEFMDIDRLGRLFPAEPLAGW